MHTVSSFLLPWAGRFLAVDLVKRCMGGGQGLALIFIPAGGGPLPPSPGPPPPTFE